MLVCLSIDDKVRNAGRVLQTERCLQRYLTSQVDWKYERVSDQRQLLILSRSNFVAFFLNSIKAFQVCVLVLFLPCLPSKTRDILGSALVLR